MRELLFLFARAFDDFETYAAHQPDNEHIGKVLDSETFIAIAPGP